MGSVVVSSVRSYGTMRGPSGVTVDNPYNAGDRGEYAPLTAQLTALARSLGGTVYLAGVDNYQLANGTTPAVVDSVVGYFGDLAGSNDATQATTANKPLLKLTGGKYNLLFDNSNDYLQTPINPTSSGYMCVAARQDEAYGSANYLIGAGKTSATIQAGVGMLSNIDGKVSCIRIASDGTYTNPLTTSVITVGSNFVADAEWTTTSAKVRINGVGEGSNTVTKDAANTGTAIIIGGLNNGTAAAPVISGAFGGAIFGVVHIPSVPSAADKATIRKLMGQIAGVQGVV